MMVDPATRQKVGMSDLIEILTEQIEAFSTEWIKGSGAKHQAGYWPSGG